VWSTFLLLYGGDRRVKKWLQEGINGKVKGQRLRAKVLKKTLTDKVIVLSRPEL
jgi:hypothetical protein